MEQAEKREPYAAASELATRLRDVLTLEPSDVIQEMALQLLPIQVDAFRMERDRQLARRMAQLSHDAIREHFPELRKGIGLTDRGNDEPNSAASVTEVKEVAFVDTSDDVAGS